MLNELTADQVYEAIIKSIDNMEFGPALSITGYIRDMVIDGNKIMVKCEKAGIHLEKYLKSIYVDFSKCTIKNVLFKNIKGMHCQFNYTLLVDCTFEDCDMDLRIFCTSVQQCHYTRCIFKLSSISTTELSWNEFYETDFQSSTFTNSNILDCSFEKCNFAVDRFIRTLFCDCDIADSDFETAEFMCSQLTDNLHEKNNKNTDTVMMLQTMDKHQLCRTIQVSGIGSRHDTTMYNPDKDWVVCGCWNSSTHRTGGTLEEFKARVLEEYPDPKNQYHKEYMNAIKLFELTRNQFIQNNKKGMNNDSKKDQVIEWPIDWFSAF